jgi:hypothetical protein
MKIATGSIDDCSKPWKTPPFCPLFAHFEFPKPVLQYLFNPWYQCSLSATSAAIITGRQGLQLTGFSAVEASLAPGLLILPVLLPLGHDPLVVLSSLPTK